MSDDAPTLTEILDGKGLTFVVDGVTFRVRPPTTEEYDDAQHLQTTVRKRLLATPEIAELRNLPASEDAQNVMRAAIAATEAELETADADAAHALTGRLAAYRRLLEERTLADEIVDERAALARDRWLTLRLLQDEAGKPLLSKGDKAEWERLPLRVKEAARPLIWVLLRMIDDAPFDSARLHGSGSK